ncbi:MAG: rod shape-determining protein MreD [Deltaproteobacteria bacterium]|nr:rod shape-determining protein MreD [Deltaproteobacteria bacterium]
MIPLAVYLALYRRPAEGLPALLIAGAFMDALSSGPIGVYITTYIWIFLVFKRMTRLLHIHYAVLFFIISCFGLLFENTVFWIAALFSAHPQPFPATGPAIVSVQLAWLAVTAPFLFAGMEKYFKAVDNVTSGSRFSAYKG